MFADSFQAPPFPLSISPHMWEKDHAFLPLTPVRTSNQVSPGQEVGTLIPCPLINQATSYSLSFKLFSNQLGNQPCSPQKTSFLWVMGHFMSSQCLCSFITNIQTSGALILSPAGQPQGPYQSSRYHNILSFLLLNIWIQIWKTFTIVNICCTLEGN